jgi:hypothetical protein
MPCIHTSHLTDMLLIAQQSSDGETEEPYTLETFLSFHPTLFSV